MQKRKTAQKPKHTNGTRKRQVHKPRSDAQLQARSKKTALARISFFSKGECRLGDQPWWHQAFWAPLQLPGVFMIPGKSPLGTQEPSAETPSSLVVKQELSSVEYPGVSLAWERRWHRDEESQSERGGGGSVSVGLGPWRRGSEEFPPGQQVLSGSWSRLGGVL